MQPADTTHLQECLAQYGSGIPGLMELETQLRTLQDATADDTSQALIELYDQTYPLLEQALWSGEQLFHTLLEDYQALFREQDALIRQGGNDERHHFILSIPVADRPAHLRDCLESILQICERFGYGGRESGMFTRIKILIAEDSREQENIRRHRELVEEYRGKGLQVHHFDLDEQYELLHAIPAAQRELLGNLLTTQPRERFYRKGQAANRNLSYLKCLQLTEDADRTLYYFIDSDQSLCVNRQGESGEEVVYALNYFHYIDRIFCETDTELLTGKMVGDPPVSPSVMTANFLDDINAFLTRMAESAEGGACGFHERPEQLPGDAAYHDLAGLFGFDHRDATFPYRCRLEGEHDHRACLHDFAGRLNDFFFGEHLTRRTSFAYADGFTRLAPARTIYPGNYIASHAGLKYIIPFGQLRLRMSGPTAGRLIAAEIGPRFASFNMPNLHRRTSEEPLTENFRPGVELENESIDLSDEFERQFFGDLMLFSAEQLVKQADVNRPFDEGRLQAVVEAKEAELLTLYQQKHDAVFHKLAGLDELVFGQAHWWHNDSRNHRALEHIQAFMRNVENNFGGTSTAYRQIHSAEHRARRRQQIIEALKNYRKERDAWDRLF